MSQAGAEITRIGSVRMRSRPGSASRWLLGAPDRLAGVDEQGGAGDEARLVVRREVHHGPHQVVRGADLPERDAGEAALRKSSRAMSARFMSVSIRPGAMAFTRIRWGASSSAICFVSISTPAFDTQ